jgi:hypothetical protein
MVSVPPGLLLNAQNLSSSATFGPRVFQGLGKSRLSAWHVRCVVGRPSLSAAIQGGTLSRSGSTDELPENVRC